MASIPGAIWAIEIGNDSLKALHLRSSATGAVEVIGFDNIPYGKILNAEGIKESERDELIALALRNFLRQNSLGKKDEVIVSVPSQNSFARFVNLPPVEQKKIPQVVKLEAGMQIPFDMSEVQWDWQLMSEPGSSEARVGIFAIKNEVVTKELSYFSNEDIPVTMVQMAPMALYNYVVFDRPELVKSDTKATVVLNIGAENTDLVVCTKSGVWQRCVPMGGNSFTRAIADTFKLNFAKAEKLKRTAAMSKYARQVFQAMRPVFSDFVSEIQRSLGFYSSSNPNTKLANVIALGGGTKLRGLLKYLQQSLQVSVERPDSFKRLTLAPDVSAAKFHENVGDFGVVYGLALQGSGLGRIESNLLPRAIASSMAWASKAKYFTYAAAALFLVAALSIGRTVLDSATYRTKEDVRHEINNTIETAEEAQRKLSNQQKRAVESNEIITETLKPLEHRDIIPKIYETVLSVLPNSENNPPQKQLYEAFDNGKVKEVKQIPRKQRKQIFVTSMDVFYTEDLESATFEKEKLSRKNRDTDSDMFSPDMGYIPMGPGGGYNPTMFGAGGYGPGGRSTRRYYDEDDQKEEEETEGQGGAGFVIMLTCYTPYENFRDLLDPAGVKDDQSKWGVVTRLMNLDETVDGNSPFELYRKTSSTHFELESQEVSLDGEMPSGIGIREKIEDARHGDSQYLLIDPMTKEVICKVPELDELGREKLDRNGNVVYQVNDHWFVMKFKLRWKDAPETPKTTKTTGKRSKSR